MATESQSNRVTELQTPKGTQYTGGWYFFLPDFNKLPYLLHSQGDQLLVRNKNMGLWLCMTCRSTEYIHILWFNQVNISLIFNNYHVTMIGLEKRFNLKTSCSKFRATTTQCPKTNFWTDYDIYFSKRLSEISFS